MPASGNVSDDDVVRAPGRSKAHRSDAARDEAREDARDFEVTRTWDLLTEGADGTITGAVEGLLEAGKRKRYVQHHLKCWPCRPGFDRALHPDSSRILHPCNEV